MKILVNARPCSGITTGITRAVRSLYSEIARLPHTEVFYFDGASVLHEMPTQKNAAQWMRKISAIWKLPDPVVFCLRSLHWLRYEYILRKVLEANDFDIYHETGFFPAKQSKVPTGYTVYDFSLTAFSKTHPRERVWFYKFFAPRRIKYASHVITISEFIKKEVQQHLNITPHAITAVPLAPAAHFLPHNAHLVSEVLQKYNLPRNYLLFVGSLEPRKNLGCIVEALLRYKDSPPLVLAGWAAWGDKQWLETANKKLKGKIIPLGYIDDALLPALYSGARALVYPSLYEGFGLPVLEAMACGCPVICSNAASLPEVAGDAALMVDPHNPHDLAHAMKAITSDTTLRGELIAKGFKRAKSFSWSKSAAQTAAVFEKIVETSKGGCCI